ncbi:MAG: tonB-system energizer ExbB [Bradyrhizobiaceae bacterium]|nr:MAG: tonB-system energizer ExbB [Bradyrhizobiaceae bacterium]
MKTLRALAASVACLVILGLGGALAPALAQQKTPVAAPSAPAASPVQPAATAPTAPTPAPTAATPDTIGTTDGSRVLKPQSPVIHELSPWSMFLSADIIVKVVMIGLAFASLVTWTVCFAKARELYAARRRLSSALAAISDSRSLAEARVALGARRSVLADFIAAALREVKLSIGIAGEAGIKERAASSFAEIVREESRRMRHGMGLLATIGATAPFVGLFGTVWGIMNSFIGISKSQTTNLAVVAPGIAEALLATAIGLVAAIPAVIIYNHFTRVTKRYLEMVNQASGATGRLLSRDLDRVHGGVSHAAE